MQLKDFNLRLGPPLPLVGPGEDLNRWMWSLRENILEG